MTLKYFCDIIIPFAIKHHYAHLGGDLLFQLTCGTPQGDPASPDLADLFCHDFEDDFMSKFYVTAITALNTLDEIHSHHSLPHIHNCTTASMETTHLLPDHLSEFKTKMVRSFNLHRKHGRVFDYVFRLQDGILMITHKKPPDVDLEGSPYTYTMNAVQESIYKNSLKLEDTTAYRKHCTTVNVSHCIFLQLQLYLGRRVQDTDLYDLMHSFFDKRNDYEFTSLRFCPATDNAPLKRLHDTFATQAQDIYLASKTAASFQKFMLSLYCTFRYLGYHHGLLEAPAQSLFAKHNYTKFGPLPGFLRSVLRYALQVHSQATKDQNVFHLAALNSFQRTAKGQRKRLHTAVVMAEKSVRNR